MRSMSESIVACNSMSRCCKKWDDSWERWFNLFREWHWGDLMLHRKVDWQRWRQKGSLQGKIRRRSLARRHSQGLQIVLLQHQPILSSIGLRQRSVQQMAALCNLWSPSNRTALGQNPWSEGHHSESNSFHTKMYTVLLFSQNSCGNWAFLSQRNP